MNKGRQYAIGRTVISLLSLAVVASLVSFAGDSARIGFVFLLPLLGLPWLLCGRSGEVAEDERAWQIRECADALSSSVTLITLMLVCVTLGFLYDPHLPSAVLSSDGSQAIPDFLMVWLATIWVPFKEIVAASISLMLYSQSENAAQA